MERDQLKTLVTQSLDAQPVTDLHTHTYPPNFGATQYTDAGASNPDSGLLLWGIDELVTYHYLIAEVYRAVPAHGSDGLPYEKFWAMPKPDQADHIWKHLFVERTPISEACRGVLTCLQKLGLDPNEKTLAPYRQWFAQQDANDYVDRVMELANLDAIVMTNPVFDDHERAMWEANPSVGRDPRFRAVLRIDPMLRNPEQAAERMHGWGYKVSATMSPAHRSEAQRFLNDWIDKMDALYVAMSLPPSFKYPSAGVRGDESPADLMLEEVILPVLAERGMPLALMIGSNLQVNPSLRDAGDMVGKADISSVTELCARFPRNKFLITMLSRENQHELCVAARKFGNLMIFGCWWFLNNPSIIEEMTRERIELLGTSFIPQHSDARILDQLLYKWDHSRAILADVLTDKYADLQATGFEVSKATIERDARLLLRDNFRRFAGMK